ncbi:hypothetical protein NUW54_g1530 [Trametes sanguinea]|uniref:Uncharacterized protein n=1 Tax=Trametes sanguinea TaxID=158606 RepID=A0ACC1Q7H5_9APHY|nr:hypothetical protein NUW54_g1530 [Trametes sanguinea]
MSEPLVSNDSGRASPSVGSEPSPEYNLENPTTRVRKRHELQRRDTVRLVIFNIGDTTVPAAWEWLQGCLDEASLRAIVLIRKVTHVSNKPRFDLWVRPELGETLKRNIRNAYKGLISPTMRTVLKRHLAYWNRRSKFPWSWRIDVYKPWRDRRLAASKPAVTTRNETEAIMTWNINGLHAKMLQVRNALATQKVAICVLQETLVSAASPPIRVDGYTAFNVPWSEGFRGLTVLVDNRIPAYRVLHDEPWLIHIRVANWRHTEQTHKGMHIVGLYFPSGGNFRGERAKKLKHVAKLVDKLQRKHPEDIVMALGDLNTPFDTVNTRLNRWHSSIRGLTTTGSNLSRFPARGKASDLDHIMGNDEALRWFRPPRVLRQYAGSDHRPVMTICRATAREPLVAERRIIYDKQMVNRTRQALAWSNRWDVVASEIVNSENEEMGNQEPCLNTATETFNQVFDEECRRHSIKADKHDSGTAPRMPRAVRRKLGRMKRYARSLADSIGSAQEDRFRRLHQKTQKEFRKLYNEWTLRCTVKSYERLANDIGSHDYKNAWRRVKAKSNLENTTGENMPMKPSQPLRDKNGGLQTSPEALQGIMAEHYKKLLQDDSDGSMRDQQHWERIWGPVNEEESSHNEESARNLNQNIGWKECLMAIREMNGGTSPGVDEVHIDVLKGLLAEECMAELQFQNPSFVRKDNIQVHLAADKLPEVPRTPMGTAVYELLALSWKLKRLPKAWEENVIVSLLKKGSPEEPDNYRGVTLIPVMEKVLTGVMMRRLYGLAESTGILDREQGGFRPGEEAIAQFISLQEAVRRRHITGMTTVGVFIDFKKAYDKVPHGLLWLTLEKAGVQGHMLDMIKAIYAQTRVSVRAGGGRSEAFALWRGLRQGCLLSPLLFIIFISRILEVVDEETVRLAGVSRVGAEIPGLNKEGAAIRSIIGRLKGLLYADDIVVLLESPRYVNSFLKALDTVCTDIGMELGLNKCGVMIWTTDQDERAVFESTSFRTREGEVPKVDEYKYLGIIVDQGFTSSREKVNGQKATETRHSDLLAIKGRGTLHMMEPLLRDRHCPLAIKVAAIRTFLTPKMMYGGEWLGFKQDNTRPLQKVVNTAMEWVLGITPSNDTAIGELLSWELGIPLIDIEMGAARTRLYAKARRTIQPMKTWLRTLVTYNSVRSAKKTWVSVSNREISNLLKKYTGTEDINWEQTREGEYMEYGRAEDSTEDLWQRLQEWNETPPKGRPWVLRTRIYETHIRANQYQSQTLKEVRQILAGIVDPRDIEEWDESPERVAMNIFKTGLDTRQEREEMLLGSPKPNRRHWESQVVQAVKDALMERTLSTKLQNSPRMKMYDEFQFACTRGYIRASIWRPDLREGVRWLAMGRAQLVPRINDQWKLLDSKGGATFDKDHCPLCNDRVSEGWEFFHLLSECGHERVRRARKVHLAKPIRMLEKELGENEALCEGFKGIAGVSGRSGFNGVAAIYLAGGVVKGHFATRLHLGFGHMDYMPRKLRSMLYVYVCSYLIEVIPLYAKGVGLPAYGTLHGAMNVRG